MLLRKSVQIPEQLADLLKMTMSGQAKLNIDLTGSEEPVQRLDKMINKLILALLCAAIEYAVHNEYAATSRWDSCHWSAGLSHCIYLEPAPHLGCS